MLTFDKSLMALHGSAAGELYRPFTSILHVRPEVKEELEKINNALVLCGGGER
jgi:hypothetical protein